MPEDAPVKLVILAPEPLNDVADKVPVIVTPVLDVSNFLFPPSWYKATEPFLVAYIACSVIFVLTLKLPLASFSRFPDKFEIYKCPGAPTVVSI